MLSRLWGNAMYAKGVNIRMCHIQAFYNLFHYNMAMDWHNYGFIEGLPTSDHKNSILVVVDKFSKYAYFIPLSHPFTAQEITNAYFSEVHKLHGLKETIISDIDTLFLSKF